MRIIHPSYRLPIHHVFHSDPECLMHEEHERIASARLSWHAIRKDDPAWILHPFMPARTSRDIGDTRAVPHLHDLFDDACKAAEKTAMLPPQRDYLDRTGADTEGADRTDGIVVWTNLDVGIVPEAPQIIRRRLAKAAVVYSRRVETDKQDWPPSWAELAAHAKDANRGMDLIAFTVQWWRSIKHEVPDFFIACDAFDFVLGELARRDNPDAAIEPPILTHERHEPFWMQPENRWTNPALKHNHALAVEWCRQRPGYAERMEAGEWSFWPEGKGEA